MQAILPIWQKRLGATFSNIHIPAQRFQSRQIQSSATSKMVLFSEQMVLFWQKSRVARALKLELIRKLFGKWEVVEPFYRSPFFFSANSSPPQAGLEHGQLHDFFRRNFQISNYRCFGVCSTKGINLKKTDICQGPPVPFISFQINNHWQNWMKRVSLHDISGVITSWMWTYSLFELPSQTWSFRSSVDTCNHRQCASHIWQNRARCAPLMDTARGTLYSVPRIELQVEMCLHMRGLFCIDHCQWNGLRFPNICSIKVPFFILDSLSGNSSIRWSLAAFCAHFLKKYALCK